eukprot:SM000002S05520  [mRNA]  locus=s2:325302:327065:- [translate_table: standard]
MLEAVAGVVAGIPTGAHGAFRDYQIDAVTVRAVSATPSPLLPLTSRAGSRARGLDGGDRDLLRSVQKLGRVLEASLRCYNNLLERLHHSHFFYVLAGDDKFLPITTYLVPLALALAALALKAGHLLVHGKTPAASPGHGAAGKAAAEAAEASPSGGGDPAAWPRAVVIAAALHAWALGVAALPPLLPSLATAVAAALALDTVSVAISLWLVTTAAGLALTLGLLWLLLRRSDRSAARLQPDAAWVDLKALMLGALVLELACLSCVNFALALGAALALTPASLAVHPLRQAAVKASTLFGSIFYYGNVTGKLEFYHEDNFAALLFATRST